MIVLAIDPGPTVSAAVLFDTDEQRIIAINRDDNAAVRNWIRRDVRLVAAHLPITMAIEMIASYGMAVGAETFETCVEIGRFIERWKTIADLDARRVYRREVKLHLCGTVRATDSNIRHALLDRFGPGRTKAVGTKANPGPLYGVSKDLWQALGVALVVGDGPSKHAS